MTHASPARRGDAAPLAATLLGAAGGLALAVSIAFPLASEGTGSATSVHELFDLLLSDHLRFIGIPRWVGLFGYLPSIGGVAVLIAEAFTGRVRRIVRAAGIAVAGLALGVLFFVGVDAQAGRAGRGLWVGALGLLLTIAAVASDTLGTRTPAGAGPIVGSESAGPDR